MNAPPPVAVQVPAECVVYLSKQQDATVRAIIRAELAGHKALAAGWVPGENVIRNAVREVVLDGFTPDHVADSMAHFMAGIRAATAKLNQPLQEFALHAVDWLDARAADPQVAAGVAEWAKGVILPLLQDRP